jgi:hypothetical protein
MMVLGERNQCDVMESISVNLFVTDNNDARWKPEIICDC